MKKITTFRKILEIAGYKKIQLWSFVSLLFIYISLVCYLGSDNLLSAFFNVSHEAGLIKYINLDLITIIFIVFIWFSNAKKDWENQLNSFVYIDFFHVKDNEEKTYISLRNYPLLNRDSEVRQMSQSIAKSVNGGENLPIKPIITIMSKSIIYDDNVNNGQCFLQIRAKQELYELNMINEKGKGINLEELAKDEIPIIKNFKS